MSVLDLLCLSGLLGAGTVGGIFFAFSSFVMPALARLDAERGLAAMQSINVAVLRPSFLGVFVGTALLSLAACVAALLPSRGPQALLLGLAGATYLVGTFLVTGTRNVPLNEALEAADPADPRSSEAWNDYLRRWTAWNHVRTAASLTSMLAFALALD